MRKVIHAAALAVAICIASPASGQIYQNKYPAAAAVSVGTSATLLITPSAGRVSIYVWNNDAVKTLYLSYSSAVTTATGWPLPPGQWIEYTEVAPAAGYTFSLYGVTTSGTIDARVQAVYPQ